MTNVLCLPDLVDATTCETLTRETLTRVAPVPVDMPSAELPWKALPWMTGDTVAWVGMEPGVKHTVEAIKVRTAQLLYEHYRQIVYPHLTNIVVWRRGRSMLEHKDDGYGPAEDYLKCRKFTSLVYLNDDFSGGETFVKDEEYVPRTGSLLAFPSDEHHSHGVREVTDGERVTLAMWFATDPAFVEAPS